MRKIARDPRWFLIPSVLCKGKAPAQQLLVNAKYGVFSNISIDPESFWMRTAAWILGIFRDDLQRPRSSISKTAVCRKVKAQALSSHSTESYCRIFYGEISGTSQLLGKCSSGRFRDVLPSSMSDLRPISYITGAARLWKMPKHMLERHVQLVQMTSPQFYLSISLSLSIYIYI